MLVGVCVLFRGPFLNGVFPFGVPVNPQQREPSRMTYPDSKLTQRVRCESGHAGS